MLIDCFTFYNELDLLEVRLNTLAPWVDVFILCEANRTFQGAEKSYIFQQHKDDLRFRCGRPILSVLVDLSEMDDFEHRLRRTSAGMSYTDIPAAAAWCREQIQRQAISQAFDTTVGPPGYCKRWDLIHELKASGLAGEGQHARIILSDVDEIPDLTIFDQISPESPTVISWKQDLYYYWVNLKCWSWIGPVSCTWETFQTRFRGDMQLLRDSRASADCVIDGGWHFSYLGGAKAIREKIEAFSHTEYLDCASPENIRQALSTGWKENRDLFGREMMKFQLMPDDSHLPRYLRENKTSFCNWWFPSGQNV